MTAGMPPRCSDGGATLHHATAAAADAMQRDAATRLDFVTARVHAEVL
jgi:hypothetical protein